MEPTTRLSGGRPMNTIARGVTLGPRTRRLVRFSARLINPVTLLIAGRRWMPIVGVLRHRGRKSGRMYATPLGMLPLGDSFVMPRPVSQDGAVHPHVESDQSIG